MLTHCCPCADPVLTLTPRRPPQVDIVSSVAHKSCTSAAPVESGNQAEKTVVDCETKYFQPKCGLAPATAVTVKSLEGGVHVYLSAQTSRPGASNYAIKDENAGAANKHLTYVRGPQDKGHLVVAIKGVPNHIVANATQPNVVFEKCSAENRPLIQGISPRAGFSGETITVTGSWRTGKSIRAACLWFYSGAAYADESSSSSKGVLSEDGTSIECRVPKVGVAQVAGSKAPAPGSKVEVAVSVWNPLAADHAEQKDCLSHHGVTPPPASEPDPEFTELHLKGSYGKHALELAGLKCPLGHADRLYRIGPVDLDRCRDACVADAKCSHYSFGTPQSSHPGICMGCTSMANAEAHAGFNVFSAKDEKAAFNFAYQRARSGIIRRQCQGCHDSHKDIYYRRITDKMNFDAYEYMMVTWSNQNNLLNRDFTLHSSLLDAVTGSNPWSFCNFNDRGIGFPRDCGPRGYVAHQWNSRTRGGQKDIRYSSYNAGTLKNMRPATTSNSHVLNVFEPSRQYASAQPSLDMSGAVDFELGATIQTSTPAGSIIAKAFPNGLWKSGGSAGQGKMLFVRNSRLCFDIGWVGVICSTTIVSDGKEHAVAVRYSASRFHVVVDGKVERSGLRATPDHTDTVMHHGTQIGHHNRPSDMAPNFVGTIKDVKYAALVAGSDGAAAHVRSMINAKQAWTAATNTAGQWVQMDLGLLDYVKGVQIQGNPAKQEWIKSFTVQASANGKDFAAVEGGKTFEGPSDSNKIAERVFDQPIRARYVRVVASSWQGAVSARVAALRMDGQYSRFQYLAPRKENGFCVTATGSDVNHGITKHQDSTITEAKCVDWCKQYPGATGCEHIIIQSNKGCYVFTTTDIHHGNNRNLHTCWVFHLARGSRTASVRSDVGNVYTKTRGVGGWGGVCTCPDGLAYEVGDHNNACGSIACDGGTITTECKPGGISRANVGMKVICGGVSTKKAATYILTKPGGLLCPAGTHPVTDRYECLNAGKTLATQPQGRTMQSGNWHWVPRYCTLQTGNGGSIKGDWATHFNIHTSPPASDKNRYSMVCRTANKIVHAARHVATSGEWKLVFRQTAGTYMDKNGWKSLNTNAPDSPNYSILSELESFRSPSNSAFKFKLSYPPVTGQQNGFCVNSQNGDVNHGIKKHADVNLAIPACVAWCQAYGGATGCEHIVNQGNRGCYVFTTTEIHHGNNARNHLCWIFQSGAAASRVLTQEWSQSSNPMRKTTSGVDGYKPIDIKAGTHHRWGGLEYNTGSSSLLDGSVNSGWWFWAIGTRSRWQTGIPGPNHAVQIVELRVWSEVALEEVEDLEEDGTTDEHTINSFTLDVWSDIFNGLTETLVEVSESAEMPGSRLRRNTGTCVGNDCRCRGADVVGCAALTKQDSDCKWIHADLIPSARALLHPKYSYETTPEQCCGQIDGTAPEGILKNMHADERSCEDACNNQVACTSFSVQEIHSRVVASSRNYQWGKVDVTFPIADVKLETIVSNTQPVPYGKGTWGYKEGTPGRVWVDNGLRASFQVTQRSCTLFSSTRLSDSGRKCADGIDRSICRIKSIKPVFAPAELTIQGGIPIFDTAKLIAASQSVDIKYELDAKTSEMGLFFIDQATGQVFQTGPLDYEQQKKHTIRIGARDRSLSCLSGFLDLIVAVKNENDNTPEVHSVTLWPDDACKRVATAWACPEQQSFEFNTAGTVEFAVVATLPEDTPVGMTVFETDARDLDGSKLFFAIEQKQDVGASRRSAPVLPFEINPETGAVVVTHVLDEAETKFWDFIVTVGDAAEGGNLLHLEVTVDVSKVDCPAGKWSNDGTYPCASYSACDYITQYEEVVASDTNDRVCKVVDKCILGVSYVDTEATRTSNTVCKAVTACGNHEFLTANYTMVSNRQCTVLTRCDPQNQYENVAPTATTNRFCTALATCNVTTEFESVPATASADRTCAKLTKCSSMDEFESSAPRFDANRVCSSLSTCGSLEFEATPATWNTDRTCRHARECAWDVEYEHVPASVSADRICKAMAQCITGEEYEVKPQASDVVEYTNAAGMASLKYLVERICINLFKCGADERQSVAPTAYSDRSCEVVNDCVEPANSCDHGTCQDGIRSYTCTCAEGWAGQFCDCKAGATFSPTGDSPCYPVDVCKDDEFEVSGPTITDNRVCKAKAKCTSDEYIRAEATASSDRVCSAITTCTSTQYRSKNSTSHSNAECTDLAVCDEAKTFESKHQTGTADRVCSPIRECTWAIQYEATPATWNTDRTCATISTCDADSYIRVPATKTSNLVCNEITQCTVGKQFQSVEANKTDDAVCDELRTCSEGEYQLTPPTYTSNRVCKELTACTSLEYNALAHTETTDRVCATTRTCDFVLEFQVNDTTASSNRVCQQLHLCAADEFISTNATTTTDRSCTTIATCNSKTQYRSKAATKYADVECSDLTVCGADEKQTVAPTLTSNRACVQIDDCLGEFCGNGQCVDGTRSFECACNEGAWGSRCECSATTYSGALIGAGSPCFPIYECAVDEFEVSGPTITDNRVCKKITTCEESEWMVSAATLTSDAVCKELTHCLVSDDMEESVAPTKTSDRQCRNVDDCATKGDACDMGTCVDKGSAAPGQIGCSCSSGFEGEYCDCSFEITFSDSPRGLVSPCYPITSCGDDEFESQSWTNSSDRMCQPVTGCPVNFYESAKPTTTTDRICLEYTPPCGDTQQIEVEAPTDTSDRVCADTTSTTITTTTITATTTTTITTTTQVEPECDLPCINGGRCVLVKSDCSDAAALFDTPVCNCGIPASDACFYGERCEAKIQCNSDPFGTSAQSCNPFIQSGRGGVNAGDVCKTASTAPALCSKGNSFVADAATGSEPVLQSDADASGSDSDSSSDLNMNVPVAMVATAGLIVLLVALLTVRRKQDARDERDKQAWTATRLQTTMNDNFVQVGVQQQQQQQQHDYASVNDIRKQSGTYSAIADGLASRRRSSQYAAMVNDAPYDDMVTTGNPYDSAHQDQETPYSRAAHYDGDEHVYSESSHVSRNNSHRDTVWNRGGQPEPVYDHGNSNNAGEAVYDQGNNNTNNTDESAYSRATTRPFSLIAEGSAGIYDMGNDTADTYTLANTANEPLYDDATGAGGDNVIKATRPFSLLVATATTNDYAVASADPTYGLASQVSGENDYGIATAPQPAGVYDNSITMAN